MRDRLVCSFAFDARADEETGKAMRFGKLTVLTARMNPDLAMAEELLRGAGSVSGSRIRGARRVLGSCPAPAERVGPLG